VPNGAKKRVAAPTELKPLADKESFTVNVVIETPKGSRNKYKFDPELGSYVLSKVLPEGMVFPFDFGFIPRTTAADGDPIDVLLLMDAPVFPGCAVQSRLIGVIEGEQSEDGEKVRNDRLIAVAIQNHSLADLAHISEVTPTMLEDIRQFFVNYNELRGTKFKPLGSKGPKHAAKLVRDAMKHKKAA
jgi:inorganic pyrophosphatase